MFEELVADRLCAVANADICRRLDKELAVEMADLLAEKLEPIKALSNFAIKLSDAGVEIEFERLSARGTRPTAALSIKHASAEKVLLRLDVHTAQRIAGYPAAAQSFNIAEQSADDMLDTLLNERRSDWAALLRNWE